MLAGKLVLVVAIYSLGGSHANRHHTLNPQSGAAQPTQDEDPLVTSNPLEYLLALHWEKVKNPSERIKMPKRGVNWANSKFLSIIKPYG